VIESPDTAGTPTDDHDDIVILIHGTFGGDKDRNDSGHRWWQRDSTTWRELESRLPDGVRLPAEGSGIGRNTGSGTSP
jgi:hypothetical protein